MTIESWLHLLVTQVRETDALQWTAVLFGVAEVLLARANKIALYPAGIISTLFTVFILFKSGLYADFVLNLYYIGMSLYGWIHWQRSRGERPLPVSYSSREEWGITLAITIGGGFVTYVLLRRYTPSTVPFWDAFVSSTAWAGTWLLARRKIENWLVLNVSNFFMAPLLFYKQLPLFALLTIFLFIIAIFGFLDWKKEYRKEQISPEFTANNP